MKVIGLIPARIGSTRLKNKPLIRFSNKTLVQHTFCSVQECNLFDKIFVLTDNKRIYESAAEGGANVYFSQKKFKNGTERCIDFIMSSDLKLNGQDLVVNIQCDEPFLKKKHFENIISSSKSHSGISTLACPIKQDELFEPNIVKVNIDDDSNAIIFSRYKKNLNINHRIYKHLGIYAYKKKTLEKISSLQPTKSETSESLEQLRWLDNNYKILCRIINDDIISINVESDLKNI